MHVTRQSCLLISVSVTLKFVGKFQSNLAEKQISKTCKKPNTFVKTDDETETKKYVPTLTERLPCYPNHMGNNHNKTRFPSISRTQA